MASNAEVKLHVKGIGEVFNSSGVVGKLESMANAIANEAQAKTEELYPSSGFERPHYGAKPYTTTHGNTGMFVTAQTPLGREAQARHNVLTQAMDAGRG